MQRMNVQFDGRGVMQKHEIILYQLENTNVYVNVFFKEETFWMTQRAMSELFDCTADNISLHLKNIYKEEELEEGATTEFFSVVQNEGGRNVNRKVKCFNVDAIIAVGYRVNSKKATRFRQWATKTLKEYIIKGFVLNDEMLKNGKPFGKDYFDELLERIREIRASERRAYQKITDVFEQCSYDYDKNSEITKNFYAFVQNKLHFAVTGRTAAELIYERADSEKPEEKAKELANFDNKIIIVTGTGFNDLKELQTDDFTKLLKNAEADFNKIWELYIAVKIAIKLGKEGYYCGDNLVEFYRHAGIMENFRILNILKQLWSIVVGTPIQGIDIDIKGVKIKIGGKYSIDLQELFDFWYGSEKAFSKVSEVKCNTYLSEFPKLRKHFERFRGKDTARYRREEIFILMDGLEPRGDNMLQALYETGMLIKKKWKSICRQFV